MVVSPRAKSRPSGTWFVNVWPPRRRAVAAGVGNFKQQAAQGLTCISGLSIISHPSPTAYWPKDMV